MTDYSILIERDHAILLAVWLGSEWRHAESVVDVSIDRLSDLTAVAQGLERCSQALWSYYAEGLGRGFDAARAEKELDEMHKGHHSGGVVTHATLEEARHEMLGAVQQPPQPDKSGYVLTAYDTRVAAAEELGRALAALGRWPRSGSHKSLMQRFGRSRRKSQPWLLPRSAISLDAQDRPFTTQRQMPAPLKSLPRTKSWRDTGSARGN